MLGAMLQTQGRVRPGAPCSVPAHQWWATVAGPVLPDKMISNPCQGAQWVPAATLRFQNAGNLNSTGGWPGQNWPHASSPCLVGGVHCRAFPRAILSPGRTNHVKNSNSLKRVRSFHQRDGTAPKNLLGGVSSKTSAASFQLPWA